MSQNIISLEAMMHRTRSVNLPLNIMTDILIFKKQLFVHNLIKVFNWISQ
jgi:hypothetical protein